MADMTLYQFSLVDTVTPVCVNQWLMLSEAVGHVGCAFKIWNKDCSPRPFRFWPRAAKTNVFLRFFMEIDQLWKSISPQPLIGSFSNFKLKMFPYNCITKKNSGQSVHVRARKRNKRARHFSMHARTYRLTRLEFPQQPLTPLDFLWLSMVP